MKRLSFGLAFALLLSGPAASAQQPSAKFAAVWSGDPLIAQTTVETCNEDTDPFDFDFATGALLATMKMPSGKEILAGVSAESLILLNTKVTGKNGGSGTATALGAVWAKLKACNVDTWDCYFPFPDRRVILNARVQSLSATLGGVIQNCTVGDDGAIDVDTECTMTNEEIGLLTANASANHSNLVFANLPQGTYQIRARFNVFSASAADTTGDACAYAGSFVVVGDRIVTLQDVRAVKGGPTSVVEIE